MATILLKSVRVPILVIILLAFINIISVFWTYGYTRAIPASIVTVVETDLNDFESQNTSSLTPKSTLKPRRTPHNLQVVTYADRNAFKFCSTIASALHHDLDLTIVGWDNIDPNSTVYPYPLVEKLKKTSEYLETLSDDITVMFIDGFDVYFNGGQNEIIEGYKKATAQWDTPSLLFTGELGCWPYIYDFQDKNVGKLVCEKVYPESPTPYRYLNSGGWMGGVREAFGLFSILKKLLQPGGDDQRIVADFYIYHRNQSIRIDWNTEVFMSLHRHDDREVWNNDQLPTWRMQDGKLCNTYTGRKPSVVHFNGGAKSLVDPVQNAMSWSKHIDKLAKKTVKVQVHGEIVQNAYEDICPLGLQPPKPVSELNPEQRDKLTYLQRKNLDKSFAHRPDPNQEKNLNFRGCEELCRKVQNTCDPARDENGKLISIEGASDTCMWLQELHCQACGSD